MKTFQYTLTLLILCSAALLAACGGNSSSEGDTAETAQEHARKHMDPTYVCPMHPNIVRHEPAACPICGMDLVEKKVESADTLSVQIDPAVIQKMGVKTTKVERGTLWKYIRAGGRVAYNERRLERITAPTYGWVENLAVRRADLKVRRGQLLTEFYSPEYLAAQQEFLKDPVRDKDKRYTDKRVQGLMTVEDYLIYLGTPESTLDRIAGTGKAENRIPLYAPQNGTIIRHNVKKRMFVPAGYEIFVIADLTSLWVELDVFEHQVDWIERGQDVEVQVPAVPGRTWKGRLNYVASELDPKSLTLKVRLVVSNMDEALKPNMYAQAAIYGGPRKDILKIPRQALIATGERESVLLALGDGKFKPANVKTGMRGRTEVEIVEGLEEGDEIVMSGQFLIDSEANLQAAFMRMSE